MNIEQLAYWVRSRESIRSQKDSGEPYPWTTDPVLAQYRFCNVRREDDRVTKWINVNIRQPYANHPMLWFMLCIGRMICWPDTLAELLEGCWPTQPGFSTENMMAVLRNRRERQQKVWTAAYLIPSGPRKGEHREVHISRHVLGPLWEDRNIFVNHFRYGPTLQETHKLLTGYLGWGNFMAYQAVVDMRYTRLLREAKDVASWAAAGPGTIRGLNRVFGRDVDKPLAQSQALTEMLLLYPAVVQKSGVEMDFSDVPNILCESDKYARMVNGEGSMKAKYVQGRGY